MSVNAADSLPKVSVAIMTFNQKPYLQDCIESVLEQDYENFEIVVADDGSTDGTQDMLEDYAARFPGRFRLQLSPANRGITINANAAHFACTGDYIAWMGGDDLMLPGKLGAQVALMEGDPLCVLSYHDLEVFHSSTGKWLYLFSERARPREGDVRAAIRFGTFNGACATMIRRAAAPPGGFDTRIRRASDWLYWIETLGGGGRIRYLDEVLGRYRRHDGNITALPHLALALAEDNILTCMILLKTMPAYGPEIFHALARNLVALARRMPQSGRIPLFVLAAMVLAASVLTTPFVTLARILTRQTASRA